MSHNAVVMFCKPPVAGRVKTRLIGGLSARQAAEIHEACVKDTIAMLNALPSAQRWLYVASRRAAAQRMAAQIRIGTKWKVVTQRGADLGERMRNAIEEQLRAGAEKVIIVGSDSPWMGRERITRALRLLDKTDVVLGPSEDGGYYLIGARKLVSTIFSEIPWGTAAVMPKTLRALRATRTAFRLLKLDFDLDRPGDLRRVQRLAARGTLRAPALTRWVRESSRHLKPNRRNKRPRPGRG